MTVDQFVGHYGGPLERQKQDSHVYWKTGTLPLIFRKNQSRHYINDEVWETVKKVWSSWRVMDAKMKKDADVLRFGLVIVYTFQIYPIGIFYIERGGAVREEEKVDGKRIDKARENLWNDEFK